MTPPVLDDAYLEEIENARRDLRALIYEKDCAPVMLCLAFSDAGTYDSEQKKGGPNGSIRKMEKQKLATDHPKLNKAVELCDEVKKDKPKITYADLYQLAGVVAVEITGGPTIIFEPGREDSTTAEDLSRLPNVDDKQEPETLRGTIKRMGLKEEDMVAVFGVLHRWDDQDNAKKPFDNSYFKELYKEKENSAKTKTLVRDPNFLKIVENYQKDRNTFLKDYAIAHKKLSELGFTPPKAKSAEKGKKSEAKPPSSWNRVRLAQGIGIAVATTVVILGLFLSRRHK